MNYLYECNACKQRFVEKRPVKLRNVVEDCECGGQLIRQWTPPNIQVEGGTRSECRTAERPREIPMHVEHYNHGLGRVCTGSEACRIASRRGWTEVGNEDNSPKDPPKKKRSGKCWIDPDNPVKGGRTKLDA